MSRSSIRLACLWQKCRFAAVLYCCTVPSFVWLTLAMFLQGFLWHSRAWYSQSPTVKGFVWYSRSWHEECPFQVVCDVQCLILRMSLPDHLWCSVPVSKNIPSGLSIMFSAWYSGCPLLIVYGVHVADTKNIPFALSMTFSAWYTECPFRVVHEVQCLLLRIFLPGFLWRSVPDTKYVPSGLFIMFTCLILSMFLPGRLWCSVSDTKYVPSGLFMMFTCPILRMPLPGRLWCSVPDTKNVPSGLSIMFTCLLLRIIFRFVYGAHIPDTQNVSSGLSVVFTCLILRISSCFRFYMTITCLTLRMSLTAFLFSRPWYSESPSFLGLHIFHVLCTQHLLLFQILNSVHFRDSHNLFCSRFYKYYIVWYSKSSPIPGFAWCSRAWRSACSRQ